MLDSKRILFGLVMLSLGIVIGWQYTASDKTVEAINVVGGEIITRSETDADFTIFKSRGEPADVTVQVLASDINGNLKGQEKDDGTAIARDASSALQLLLNFHQQLADIQAENPCPSLEDWEDADGVPGGTEPNPIEYPDCDPDVLYDPARCTLFWEDLDPHVDHPVLLGNPNDTLTSRNVMVEIAWDGTLYNLRLANPSSNPANFPDNC